MIDNLTNLKASQTNEIRLILRDHLFYRAAVKFKNGKKLTLYGHEHCCTYNQVKAGHIKEIILNANKGYTGLVKYIEAKAGLVKTAKIYGREVPGDPFNTIHRSWYEGKWEIVSDPVINPENLHRNLRYEIINGLIEFL